MFGHNLFISVLVVSICAERPSRGPKVSDTKAYTVLSKYVPRPSINDKQVQSVIYQPVVPQQVIYQSPQAAYQPNAKYVQQPVTYQHVVFQPMPVRHLPQGQVAQPVQYQPIQYVPVELSPNEQYEVKESEEKEESAYAEEKDMEEESSGKNTIISEDPEIEKVFGQSVSIQATRNERRQGMIKKKIEELVGEPEFIRATPNERRMVQSVVKSAVGTRASLYSVSRNDNIIASRLPSNFTTIRANESIVDGFSCAGRKYGYYSDVANDCQIFHICLNYAELYMGALKDGQEPQPSDTYTFSFICPKYTRFAQDYLVCGWEKEVPDCAASASLYESGMNARFFEIYKVPETGGDDGERRSL